MNNGQSWPKFTSHFHELSLFMFQDDGISKIIYLLLLVLRIEDTGKNIY